MNDFIDSNIEALDQMTGFIENLSDAEYQHIAAPYIESSIGQHLRHVLDIYTSILTVIDSRDTNMIDYNTRRRGAPVETQRAIGLTELQLIRTRLHNSKACLLETDVRIITETSIANQKDEEFKSTLPRELCFASAHLTHHLALMAVVAKLNGKNICSSIGTAPATATFIRENKIAAI